jgi:hypothetical protein
MLLTDTAFIGITPIPGNKSLAYAALDRELKLIALADGEMDDVTAFIAGLGSAVAAINMPAGVNFGLVHAITKSKKPTAYQIRRNDLRLAEHELREHGISITKTPASVEECPAWMQAGFELYRKLSKMGFQKYPDKDAAYLVLETNSHACHCVMAGQIPLGRLSLAGRMQRQLVLYEHGLGIKDPMDFFEEVTRYKISKGILPMELLYLPDQLDAMAAAYTAWLAVKKQESVFMIGDLKEGKIFLPERELKEKYQ